MEEQRTTLTTGMRSRRYILIPVMLFCILDFFDDNSTISNSIPSFIVLVVSLVLYYLINNSRWMSFDDNNLYIINGKREKSIHFTDIVSIKKSATKISYFGRFWKIRYKEGDGTEKTRRYYPPFLGKEQKQFYTAVQKVNSKVVVWTHPHFNHDQFDKKS